MNVIMKIKKVNDWNYFWKKVMWVKGMIKGKNYEITAKNILGHEIIGLGIKVIDASDLGRKGIEGIVVDETQKTFTVLGKHASGNLKGQKEKKFVLPKEECVFEFDLIGEKIIVNGKDIMRRPEDRVKEWRN